MQATLHQTVTHTPVWVVALVCVSAISVLILAIASVRQSLRLNLFTRRRWPGSMGVDFTVNAVTWDDINEAADRPPVFEDEQNQQPPPVH